MDGDNSLQVKTRLSRQGRRIEEQLAHMVDYFITHPYVVGGRLTNLHAKESELGSWDKLVIQLNDMRNNGTKTKDLKSWKECWSDMKYKTSRKAALIRQLKAEPDNEKVVALTDLEKKILTVIGWEIAEGLVDCPDSFPEEQPGAIKRLCEGDETPLRVPPLPLTTQPNRVENNMAPGPPDLAGPPRSSRSCRPLSKVLHSMVTQKCGSPKASCSKPSTTKRKLIDCDDESCGHSETSEGPQDPGSPMQEMDGDNSLQVKNRLSRQGRRSEEQVAHMVDYFITHPHVAGGRRCGPYAEESERGSWDELVAQLNDMRNIGTKTKDVKSWKECWRDLKCKTSRKANRIRRLEDEADDEEVAVPSLTDLEMKILKIIGWEFSEARIDCPDSLPEEQPGATKRLCEQDNKSLRVPPLPLTAQPDGIHNTEQPCGPSEDSGGLYGTSMASQKSGPQKATLITPPTTNSKRMHYGDGPRGSTAECEGPQIPGPTTLIRNGGPPKASCITAPNAKKKRRERLSSWLRTAKDNFANLAVKNAERMERLVESIEKQSACTASLVMSMEKQSTLMTSLIQSMEKQNAMTASAIQEMAATNSTLAALLVEKSNVHR